MGKFQGYEWYNDLVDGKLKEEALKKKAIYVRSWGNATQGVINFCAWLNGCFRNFHEFDYELLVKLKEYWWKMNDHECSLFSNCKNHINGAYVNTNIDANYNPYLDVSRTFNNHEGWNDEKDILKEREPNDDHGIGNLNNDLVRDNASYHANNKEYEENRCELLRNPRQELPVCEIRRFEIIKYSFGPAEKYLAIKECEYDDLTRIKDNACHAYQEIFRIMDEGWTLLNENDDFDEVFIFWNSMCCSHAVSAAGNVVSTAGDATTVSATTTTIDHITLAQALMEIKSTKPKEKGVVIQELEHVKPMKKKDLIRLDEEVSLKLQAEFDEEERLAKEKAKKEKEANISLIETWDDIQEKIDVDH
ncbi:hypothetical protein Tco_0450162 [Tanacetum coccineum]